MMLLALGLLTHRYGGITNDAQLYAIQALAKIHPDLQTDLYLRNTSQDEYTLFSPFYARIIGFMGLPNAALLLWGLCRVWFIGAAWALVRQIARPAVAWLAIAMLLMTPAGYGGSGVFYCAEDFLSARSIAEPMIVTALALHVRGLRSAGLATAAAALLVHPLMALPGLLLVASLDLRHRIVVAGAAAGIFAAFCIAYGATVMPAVGKIVTLLDPAWLEIVRERSQFLFLQLWSANDWALNARPFVLLTLAAAVFQHPKVRDLCAKAMLVGAAGLAVALIAGTIGPIAILLQGQAWRWIWIADLLSIVLMVPTAARMCRAHRCGAACTLLLVAAWDFPSTTALLFTSAALAIWLSRALFADRLRRLWLPASGAALIGILAWLIAHHWPILANPQRGPDAEPLPLQVIRNLLEFRTVDFLAAAAAAYGVIQLKAPLARAIAMPLTLAACLIVIAWEIPPLTRDASARETAEFADWIRAIPPTASVFVAGGRNSGSFVWFTLGRPNYLTLSQSAGVVFSRETALEVRRRAEVLAPILKPSWKVMTNNAELRAAKDSKNVSTYRALKSTSLAGICADPQLGFVIAAEDFGLEALRHEPAGSWQGWYLYDCRKLRGGSASS